MSLNIKKGDKVEVLSGKDKGKKGNVLSFNREDSRVIVEGINLVTKHMKRRSENETGGIKAIPASMHISKVALVCPSCDKGVRFSVKVLEDKTKVRMCKKCNQNI